jgi:hypothetical protein
MERGSRERGMAIVLAALVLLLLMGAALALEGAAADTNARRNAITTRSLAAAREALIAHAADRPIDSSVGPGYLPCPDLDDDGWAESTCGSLNGDSGQEQRLGRLPWKTLGLPDLRDGYNERLWYAVSTKYKGLLNCAASRGCLDMSPPSALGTISVRDPSGAPIHDGTLASATRDDAGAVAVVLAPGPALDRQRRDCGPGECDAAGRCLTEPPRSSARCDPANYLDKAPGDRYGDEDNADFVDRSDAAGRARNRNGFIHGPVVLAGGRIAVNDRLAVIAYRDVMPRIRKRVALEVGMCLRYYAGRPENAGRFPAPAPTCAGASTFGTVPDTPFTHAGDTPATPMLERWWRVQGKTPESLAELPTRDDACRIAVAPNDPGPTRLSPAGSRAEEGSTAGASENSWWNAWRPFVFYSLAPGPGFMLTLAASCPGENPSGEILVRYP